MRWVAMFAALLLVGCQPQRRQPSANPGPPWVVIEQPRNNRRYLVETPPQCEGKTCPAVIWFCDSTQLTETSAREVGLDELSKKHGFVLVIPEGAGGSWTFFSEERTGASDNRFLDQLIDTLPSHGIDAKRIYAVGNGTGGWMAHKLATMKSDRIAAMAEAGSSVAWLDSMWQYHGLPEPKRPVSVMMMHGLLDDTVSYDMRSYSLDIPGAAGWWAKRVAPQAKPVRDALAGGSVDRDSWKGKEAEVQLLTFRNCGHEWPGFRSDGLDVNETLWTFLSDKSL